MLHKFIFLSVLLTGISNKSFACEICGYYICRTPYDNQSQFGILHRYRNFNGYFYKEQPSGLFSEGAYKMQHGSHGNNAIQKQFDPSDYESYKTVELRIKYFIHRRVEINSIIPFHFNKFKIENEKGKISGLGDPTIQIGLHLIRKIDSIRFQQRLIAGAGIKISSGNYYVYNSKNERYPLLLQPGTGSVDGMAYINYMAGIRTVGATINLMYKHNGKNYFNEKIADSFSLYANFFLRLKRSQCNWMPSVQFYLENTRGLNIDNTPQPGTAMHIGMLGFGLDINYRNFIFNYSLQKTLFEKEQTGNMRCAGRMVAGIAYCFNQKNYLLK